jgi:hypothetical protein
MHVKEMWYNIVDKVGGTGSTHGDMANTYKLVIGKPEEKGHLRDMDVVVQG